MRNLLILASAPVASVLCARGALAQQNDPINLPPLNGFQPLVIFGMTDEQYGGNDPTDLNTYFSQTGTTPGANGVPSQTLPVGQPQKYFIAVVDTGAQASVLSVDTTSQIDLLSAGREGNYTQPIIGASGSENTDITDPVGIYMTDLGRGVSGSTLSVQGGTTFAGIWNTSVLTARDFPTPSVLPNIIGSPAVGLYQLQIKNSQPTHVTVGGTTYKSPKVDFVPINRTIDPAVYGRVALTTTNNVGGPPAFTPSFDDFDNLADNPAAPSVWESLFANTTVTHTGGSSLNSFFFDTGAQVSVLSADTAAAVGIHTTGDNATPPDFFTEILGVGGSITEVPGYYVNNMSMTSTSETLSFNKVPIIVLDLPDPRNPNQTLPGIIGMNLFTAYDIIVNIDTQATGKTGLYVSPQWSWKFNGSGNWGDSTKWRLALPNGIDMQANFFSAITTPQTVTVNGAFTVGSLSFDNANRYTLANGPGSITLDTSTGNAELSVKNGSHTINAPVTLADETDLNVLPAGSVLTINGAVTASGVAINKNGLGRAEMTNVRAAALNVNFGTLTVLQNGTAGGTSRLNSLTVATGAKLDLKDNDLVVTAPGAIGTLGSGNTYSGITGLIQSGRNGGAWTGSGIVTSMTAATNGSGLTSIGVATAAQAKGIAATATSTWSGQTVTGSDTLVMYTYGGDANLDGKINIDDYGHIDTSVGTGKTGWFNGDFNYDGVINIDDYGIIDVNIGVAGSSLLSAAGDFGGAAATAVPEPAGVGILLAGLSFLRRRRRA